MNPRAAVAIAGLELRRRIRDRSLFIQGIIGPLVLATIVGFAFGGGDGLGAFTIRLDVADEDRSLLSEALVDGLDAASAEPDGPPVTIVRSPSRDDVARIADQLQGPAMVVPPGFGDGDAGLEILVPDDRPIVGDIIEAVAANALARVDARQIAIRASGRLVAEPPPPGFRIQQVAVGGTFNPVSYFAPAMAMLFLFFTVGASARTLLEGRHDGTLARVRASPVGDASILAGTALASVGMGALSVGGVWAITSVFFGADWGDPVLVAVVLALVVVLIGGIGAIVAGLATTEDRANAVTAAIAFVMGLLGGAFGRFDSLPGPVDLVADWMPNGIALRSLIASSAGDATLADELGSVVVLAIAAAFVCVIGARIVVRKVR